MYDSCIFKGFLSFEALLNCNNLKKLNATKENMISSIKDSKSITVTED